MKNFNKKDDETNNNQRLEALELLLGWAIQCDFGLDNVAVDYCGKWDDSIISYEEFEERTKNMNYTESMIEYAKIYIEQKKQ